MTMLPQPKSEDWEPIKLAVSGESYGVRWEEHHLEVFSMEEGRWGWSMTHPYACDARGTAGTASTRKQAEARAIGAAEGCREFGSPRYKPPKRRKRTR